MMFENIHSFTVNLVVGLLVWAVVWGMSLTSRQFEFEPLLQ